MSLSKTGRFRILARDHFTCRYCGRSAPAVTLEVDHIHPRCEGGSDYPENLVASCHDCNNGKRDKLLPPITPDNWATNRRTRALAMMWVFESLGGYECGGMTMNAIETFAALEPHALFRLVRRTKGWMNLHEGPRPRMWEHLYELAKTYDPEKEPPPTVVGP